MIVIGDVHGCYKTLLALISRLPKDAELCFVGDLIDRGTDSKKVVEYVKGGGHLCVLGNHEDMVLQAVDEPNGHAADVWLMNGGVACLESYSGAVDADHVEWFASLPYTIDHGEFVISHSNAAFGIKQHDAKTLTIWNRDFTEFFTDGRINVFGHTPVDEPLVNDAYVLIDTGCVFGLKLSAYDTETGEIYQQGFVG